MNRLKRFILLESFPGDSASPRWPAVAGNLTLSFLILVSLFYVAFSQVTYQWAWGSVARYWYKFVYGWGVTVGISFLALAASLVVGLAFALAQRSRILILRYFSKMYVEVVRGTPLLVQILIFFYVVAESLQVRNRYVVGVLILAFFSAAYICEIIRGGIESVGRSQIDSARAVGLTRTQTYRYVIFPQAIRQILPSLTGQWVSLIKDSSLLSIISIREFTLNAQEVNAFTYSAFESYLPLAVGYLLLTLPISMWTRRLERKYRFET